MTANSTSYLHLGPPRESQFFLTRGRNTLVRDTKLVAQMHAFGSIFFLKLILAKCDFSNPVINLESFTRHGSIPLSSHEVTEGDFGFRMAT